MKPQFLPLAAAWMSALVTPATAGQPLRLSDAQMDRVTAGAVGSATSSADASGNLAAQTLTFVLGSADLGSALATGLSTASASSLLSPATATSKSTAIARAP